MKIFKKSNIPNIMSVFRLLLVPVFVCLYFKADTQLPALFVFFVAGATDIIDGILARKFGWISDVGKILDPAADKCMQTAALICLAVSGALPGGIVVILISKEVILLIGSVFALKKENVYVHSNWYGKAGTVAFYIIATLFVVIEDMSDTLGMILGTLLILFMLFALVMYIINYIKNINKTNVRKG